MGEIKDEKQTINLAEKRRENELKKRRIISEIDEKKFPDYSKRIKFSHVRPNDRAFSEESDKKIREKNPTFESAEIKGKPENTNNGDKEKGEKEAKILPFKPK